MELIKGEYNLGSVADVMVQALYSSDLPNETMGSP